jgi:hypothetical protein
MKALEAPAPAAEPAPKLEPARDTAAQSALHPGLHRLIDRGTLTRAQAAEVAAFDAEARALIAAGEMTHAQVDALGRMLGLRYVAESGRRSIQ